MKILFLARPGPDYLKDTIFHGLWSLGHEVWDWPRQSQQYDDGSYPSEGSHGLLFGLYGLVPADSRPWEGSDEEARSLVADRFFDVVVFGTWDAPQRFRGLGVFERYDACDVAILDGDDRPALMDPSWLGKARYFKREWQAAYADAVGWVVEPIGFGFPEEKIRSKRSPKSQLWSRHQPGQPYCFREDSSYYDDIARSRYALTRKRAGWDCFRHYEIVFNRTIPWFPGLSSCPPGSLYGFPRGQVMRHICRPASERESRYESDEEAIFECAKYWATTKRRAEMMLRRMEGPSGP